MELKYDIRYKQPVAGTGFNRTLNGIEIHEVPSQPRQPARFNRTLNGIEIKRMSAKRGYRISF